MLVKNFYAEGSMLVSSDNWVRSWGKPRERRRPR
jgi:hypothetical protein